MKANIYVDGRHSFQVLTKDQVYKKKIKVHYSQQLFAQGFQSVLLIGLSVPRWVSEWVEFRWANHKLH